MRFCQHCSELDDFLLDALESYLDIAIRQDALLDSGQNSEATKLDGAITEAKAAEWEASRLLSAHLQTHLV
jgi:hypothetical protein